MGAPLLHPDDEDIFPKSLVPDPWLPLEESCGELSPTLDADYVSLSVTAERLIRCRENLDLLNQTPGPLVRRIRLLRDCHGPHPRNPAFKGLLKLRSVARMLVR